MARLLAVSALVALCSIPMRLGAVEIAPTLVQDIPAQPMEMALKALQGQQERVLGRSDIYWSDAVSGWTSCGVKAGLSFDAALRGMLQGTGLTIDASHPPDVNIALARSRSAPCERQDRMPDVELAEVLVNCPMISLCAIPMRNAARYGISVQPANVTRGPEEERHDGDHGIDGMHRLVPGLDWSQLSSVGGNIYTILAIYGVIERHGNTTGIWWDHIPLPAAASNSFARTIPYNFDIDSTTIRFGPQPVLLGANAQSGAIEYMPVQPDLHVPTGQLRSEWALTEGGDPTRELGAAWGAPLKDGKLAFRVSGWYRSEGGFVDRVDQFAPGRPVVDRNANRLTMESARVALRLDPAKGVTLLPSLVYQSTIGRDSPSFMIWEDPARDGFSDPTAGKFHNGSIIRQPISDSFRLASLRTIVERGSIQLESITGYIRRYGRMTSDDSTSVRWRCLDVTQLQCAYPESADDLVTTRVHLAQSSFTQQVQLSYTRGDTTLLGGGFFSDRHSRETDYVFADPVPPTIQYYYAYLDSLGQSVPSDFFWTVPTTTVQRQWAGFAQAEYHLAERLTMSAGVRVEHQRVQAVAGAPSDGSIPDNAIDLMQLRNPLPVQSETVVAPQFGLSYRPGDQQSPRSQEYYVFRATGYAPGSVDAARPTCREPPTLYPSDKLHSIQLGTRQGWDNGQTQLEFELFELDWNNGPQAWRTCLFMHLPGKARSRGMRLGAQTSPLGGAFHASIEAAYVDARYRQTIRNDYLGRVTDTGVMQGADDSIIVRKGDALGTPPQVIAPWNVKLTLDRKFPLGRFGELTLRLIDTYHSRNPGPFYSEDPEARYPGNLQPDPANNLLTGRAILKRRDVELSVFVENMLDSRPVLSKRNKGNDQNTLFYATTFRPRTVGVSVNWNIKGVSKD